MKKIIIIKKYISLYLFFVVSSNVHVKIHVFVGLLDPTLAPIFQTSFPPYAYFTSRLFLKTFLGISCVIILIYILHMMSGVDKIYKYYCFMASLPRGPITRPIKLYMGNSFAGINIRRKGLDLTKSRGGYSKLNIKY